MYDRPDDLPSDEDLPGDVPSGDDSPETRPPIVATYVVKIVLREGWSRAKGPEGNDVPTLDELSGFIIEKLEAERSFAVSIPERERTDN